MKLNFSSNPVSIKNGEYIINLSSNKPDFHSLVACIKTGNITIASYDISYEVDYKGYIGCSIVYIMTGVNYKNSSLYFKDVHEEELDKLIDDNSTVTFDFVLIYHNSNSNRNGQSFNIRQLFYWKYLGYEAIGIDFVNDKVMKKIRRFIKSEVITGLSDKIGIHSSFKESFDKPSYEFASKCEEAMKRLGLPDHLTDEGLLIFEEDMVDGKIKIECVYKKQLHPNKHRKAKK